LGKMHNRVNDESKRANSEFGRKEGGQAKEAREPKEWKALISAGVKSSPHLKLQGTTVTQICRTLRWGPAVV